MRGTLPWVYDPDADPADETETGEQLEHDPALDEAPGRSHSHSRSRSRSSSPSKTSKEREEKEGTNTASTAPSSVASSYLDRIGPAKMDLESKIKNRTERRKEEREWKHDKRQRSRSRSRSRKRKRSSSRRRTSRSRSRSTSPWRRHRSRSRDRDRGRDRSPRERRRGGDWDSRDRDRDRDREQRRRSPPAPAPNAKCVIPNLPVDVDKDSLTIAFAKLGYLPQSIRVVNKYDRGSARAIAFVDFEDADTAKACMELTKGVVPLIDGRTTVFEYCKYDSGGPAGSSGIPLGGTFGDWNCVKCGCNNFTKRENCYQCQAHRSETIEAERSGLAHVGAIPCDTVLIRELPGNCTEQKLTDSLMAAQLKLEIVRVKMSDSKRFGLVQLKSADEASRLLNAFNKAPLVISGSTVIMTFAKDSLGKLIASKLVLQTLESLSATRERERIASRNMQGAGFQMDATAAAADVAQRALQKAAIMRQVAEGVIGTQQAVAVGIQPNAMPTPTQYRHPPRPSPQLPILQAFPTSNYAAPPPTVNPYSVPPPGYQPAQRGAFPVYGQAPPASQIPLPGSMPMTTPPPVAGGVLGSVETPKGTMKKFISPNPASFTHDAVSGYYVDPVTSFYYDPNTSYYYNATTNQWTRWDPVFSTYFPVEDSSEKKEDAKKNGAEVEKKDTKKEEQPKTAADVTKEMLKWQKKTEKAKVSMSLKPMTTGPKLLETKSAFGKIAKKDKETRTAFNDDDDDDEEKPSATTSLGPAPALPAAALANSAAASRAAAQKREELEASLVDEASKQCLLCRRAFKTVEVLQKHVQRSDLHKKNLEAKRLEWGTEYVASTATGAKSMADGPTKFAQELAALEAAQQADQKIQYRDRAKERRNKFGIDIGEFEEDRDRPGPASSSSATAAGGPVVPLDSSNVGNRLLRGMGWQEGQGVGKHNQGIVNPIEAQMRVQGAGLGSAGSKILHGVNASHRDRVKAVFAEKFRELQDNH